MNATLRPSNRNIHPNLRDVYKTTNARALAILTDCTPFEVSRWMNHGAVSTPPTVERLTRIADALGYSGPIFEDETMTVINMIVARWLAEHATDTPIPDVDALVCFCFDHFGNTPSTSQAVAVRRTLLALRDR